MADNISSLSSITDDIDTPANELNTELKKINV